MQGVIVAVEFEEGDEVDVLGLEVGFWGGGAGAEDLGVVGYGGGGEEGAEGFGWRGRHCWEEGKGLEIFGWKGW